MNHMPSDRVAGRVRTGRARYLGTGAFVALVLSVNPTANAQENAEEAAAPCTPCEPAAEAPKGPWSGNVRLGYLATSGNSDTTNANFAFGVNYAAGKWNHGLSGSAVGASQDDETTAEAYTLGWRSTYDLTERDYMVGRIDWLKDKFSGYDQQLSQSIGYGRRLIVQPHQKWNVEIGAGARQSELRTGEEQKETILRLGTHYEYLFNESARLDFDMGVEAGEDNTFTEAVLGLRTRLVGSLAAVLAYTVRNNTDVPADTEKTDTMTSVSLEYSF